MSVRDHTGITLDVFNGLWQRGDIDKTPIDHFSDSNNIDFVGNAFGTRPGIGISQTVDVPLDNIIRIYNYPTQTANTLIVLAIDSNGNGNIYHVVSSTLVYGPILTIAGMTDFAFVAYAGRGYISPIANSKPALTPPAAMLAALANGTGLSVGVYQYASTFITSIGETTPSPLTSITTIGALTDPGVNIPIITDNGPIGGNVLVPGATYQWKVTFSRDSVHLTNPSNASVGLVAPANNHLLSISLTSGIDPTLFISVYRTIANGAIFYQEYNNISVASFSGTALGTISDAAIVASPVAPSSNNTQLQQVALNSIPVDSTGSATSRRLYRTKVGVTQLQSLHTIADNTTTTYTDTTADSGLGGNAPTANTAYTGTNLITKGMSGQPVYVYAGDGTAARAAAGSGLAGIMTIANGTGGHTDPGQRIFGIVSQTISGYNTPPTVLTPFVTNGTSVSFGSIPTSGNAAVVKRLLVSTIAIPAAEYLLNPNPLDYQFFFVPNAVINNNTDTFLNNISFYDADLLADASSLLNNYTTIPAGAVLNLYHNRLVVAATFTDISLALVSLPGEPEAISQISGLIVAPLDGNPITNAQEYRDVLYLFKRARTLSYADNGGEPSSWPLVIIDNALGCPIHGIATVLDSGSSSVDFLLVTTYQGISQFNGKYVTPELTWKISAFWQALDRTQFNSIQIVNEPVSKKIYCVLPTNNLLVGNYVNGMDWKNIRWSPWSFFVDINTVAIQNISDVILGANL